MLSSRFVEGTRNFISTWLWGGGGGWEGYSVGEGKQGD